MHFGVREHAMGSIMNGLSLTKLRPFGATFFVFSDYARPAIRLSALMELPTIFVFTHDAMGDGEDGPTHQPVEHLASLRAIPGLVTLRPGDANEVVEAYRYLMPLRREPAVLVLSRQPLPTLDRSRYASAAGVARGAYVLADPPDGKPEVILIATGSEVALAVEAHEQLARRGCALARRLDAVLGHLRASAKGVPRERPAPGGHGAHRDRAGVGVRLGALHRPNRPGHRHADLRRLGAVQGADEGVRLHGRECRRGGQGPIGAGGPIVIDTAVKRGDISGSLTEPADFSLVLGGPLYQLLRRSHLTDDALTLVHRRILAFVLITWLPLLLLSTWEGRAWWGSTEVPFLLNVEAHARFLLALPLLVLAELVVHLAPGVSLVNFFARDLIRDADRPRFDAIIVSAMGLRNSLVAELVLVILVYGIGIFVARLCRGRREHMGLGRREPAPDSSTCRSPAGGTRW